jgi:hypothetical protein
MTIVIVVGLIVFAAISVGFGVVIGGELNARERRRLADIRWKLWRWEQELLGAADIDGCPGCVLLRKRAGLQRSVLDSALR